MNPLEHLASLLRPATQTGGRSMMTACADIDKVVVQMQQRMQGRRAAQLSPDLQFEAVRRFWQSQEVKAFRDAYLLSWSLCLPHCPQGACILEDRVRLQCLLDGVDQWRARPQAFRRCYQGLVKSYFTFDPFDYGTSPLTRGNWVLLREYLKERNRLIKDKGAGRLHPDWVDAAQANCQLFGDKPCAPYVQALLRGDSEAVDRLCEQLGIAKASWFLRELVLEQVEGATALGHAQFEELLPRLLQLLAANEVLRDRGMMAVLDRYASIPNAGLHPELRNHAVAWWGNPWLPSNTTRWGGVTPAARTMVADWLKLEFIETFFTKLAEDGLGDPRRMNFWKRYVTAIEHIEFALGSIARNSIDQDFVVLRHKMKGLVCALDASGNNNAFIMRMGPLVAVEFSGLGNAFYGYDARRSVPFDTAEMLRLVVNGANSLKRKDQAVIWLSHQDGIHGWRRWEPMFEQTLRKSFGVAPSQTASQFASVPAQAAPPSSAPSPSAAPTRSSPTPSPPRPTTPVQPSAALQGTRSVPTPQTAAPPNASSIEPYSRLALDKIARRYSLVVQDLSARGGNLWVRTDQSDGEVTRTLTAWGFRHRQGKGWFK